jgi:hypothetical protein
MGWLFTYGQTRKQLIHERTTGWKSEKGSTQCLTHCTRGNVLWAVWERYHRDTGHFERYITCDLMQTQRSYGWGYKDMCESMHPYYYSCPEKYLDMVPKVASQAWREKVREYHARRKAMPKRRRFRKTYLVRIRN